MPDIKLLSGTRGMADVDITYATRTGYDDAAGTATSMKCAFRTVNFRATKGMNPPMVTFCDEENGWVTQEPGFKAAEWALGGYEFIGIDAADPLFFINQDYPTLFTMTKASGCSIAYDGWVTLDDGALEARGNSARQIAGGVTGEPTSTWIKI